MSDKQHKSELVNSITNLITDKDQKPLHPKNEIALYKNHVLSKSLGILLLQTYLKPGLLKILTPL